MSDQRGLEYQGKIIVNKEGYHNSEELWYIAKNMENYKDKANELKALSKIWYNQETFNCKYDDSLVEKINEHKKNIYYKF